MSTPMTAAERAHRADAVRMLRNHYGPQVTRQQARAAYKMAKKQATRQAVATERYVRRLAP